MAEHAETTTGKKIGNRVGEAFEASDRESLKAYLEWARAVYKEYADALRRSALFLFLTMGVFLILGSVKGTELSIGPLKLSVTSAILSFFPTLAAYFYLEVAVYSIRMTMVGEASEAAFKLWNQKASEFKLIGTILSPSPPYWTATIEVEVHSSRTAVRTEILMTVIAWLVGLVGTLVFQVYAFIALFRWLHAPKVLASINLCATLVMIFIAITFMFVAGD